MLPSLIKIVLDSALLLGIAWLASCDYCLVRYAPASTTIDVGALVLGAATQLVGVFLAFVLINTASRYLGFLRSYTHDPTLRAICLLVPFAFMFFSRDLIAYALYNAGANNKIETARQSDAALTACCFPWEATRYNHTDR